MAKKLELAEYEPQFIEQQLTVENVAEKIKTFEEETKELSITSHEDKTLAKLIDEKRREGKRTRVFIENLGDKATKILNQKKKEVKELVDKFVQPIEAVEKRLASEYAKYEELVQAEQERVRQEEETRKKNLRTQLLDAGFTYDPVNLRFVIVHEETKEETGILESILYLAGSKDVENLLTQAKEVTEQNKEYKDRIEAEAKALAEKQEQERIAAEQERKRLEKELEDTRKALEAERKQLEEERKKLEALKADEATKLDESVRLVEPPASKKPESTVVTGEDNQALTPVNNITEGIVKDQSISDFTANNNGTLKSSDMVPSCDTRTSDFLHVEQYRDSLAAIRLPHQPIDARNIGIYAELQTKHNAYIKWINQMIGKVAR